LFDKQACMELVKEDENEVLLTMGAGDIDRLVNPVVQILNEKWGD